LWGKSRALADARKPAALADYAGKSAMARRDYCTGNHQADAQAGAAAPSAALLAGVRSSLAQAR